MESHEKFSITGKNSKALLTLATGSHQDLLELSLPSFQYYAQKFNYTLIVQTEPSISDRPVSWEKINAVLDAFSTHDEVLCIDADAIILDFEQDLSDVISEDTELAFAAHEYEGRSNPNAGVFLVRKSEASIRFLTKAYEQVDLIDHPWWETAAMIRLLQLDHPFVPGSSGGEAEHIKYEYIDNFWNMIRQSPSKRVGIRHFAGETQATRLISMAELVLTHPGLNVVRISNPSLIERASEIIHSVQGAQEASRLNINALKSELESVKSELQAQITGLQNELNTMANSRSWKLTRPLRWLRSFQNTSDMR